MDTSKVTLDDVANYMEAQTGLNAISGAAIQLLQDSRRLPDGKFDSALYQKNFRELMERVAQWKAEKEA